MKGFITFIKFDDYDEKTYFSKFENDINECAKKVIVTPNLDFLRVAYKNKDIRRLINSADYSTIDGKPILSLAKKEKKYSFKYKVSGSDLVCNMLPLIDSRGWSIVIFGGKEGVGNKAKDNIVKKYPNIRVKAVICPKFGFEKDAKLMKEYVSIINEAKPDIVLLCVGFPKQELFYYNNKDFLCNSLYFCVGATVDFLAGTVKRAPKWMSKIGLEWLYRMFKDFKRLFPRYWKDAWFLLKIKWLLCFNKKKIERLREV